MNDNEPRQICGASTVDASPESLSPRRLWLSGYMPTRFATEQSEPIQVRALAIGDDRDGLAIISCDTCIITPRMAHEWARAIAERIPLSPERIFIITSHTHSGPDLTGLFGGVPKKYFKKFRNSVIKAASQAWANRMPARLRIGVSTHSLGIPRRASRGQTSTENTLVSMQWKNEDKVIATLLNLGCHGVVYPRRSRLLSADLPGALCRACDNEFGGTTLFAPRVQGDVNPAIPGDDPYEQNGNTHELHRLTQSGLASVRQAVNDSRHANFSRIRVNTSTIHFKPRTAMGILFSSKTWSGNRGGAPGELRVNVRRFSIGGAHGLAVPGEVLTCLGRQWLSDTKEPGLLFSYCGGYTGYLMTPETYSQGGYETMMSPGPVHEKTD